MLSASGTWGTPGSDGVFWSNLSTASRGMPCRAATSSTPGRPAVRRVAVGDGVGQRARGAHAGTAAACSGSPSTRASGATTAAARRAPVRVGGDDLQRLEERLDPEPAGRAGEPARRQHVRGARRVVADHRGATDEDRAGIPDARDERARVGDVQLEVLGRVGLRPRERLVERLDALDAHVAPAGDRGCHGRGELRIGREEQRVAVRAVLGLGEEVRRDATGVGGRVGDHDDLARAGGQIDPHATRDEQLRGRHVRVARPGDRVDGRNRLRAVGERGHRLRAADRIDLVDPELPGDDERRLGGLRSHDGDARDARDAAPARLSSRATTGAVSCRTGTQRPTAASGSQRRSETIPGAASTDRVGGTLRLAEPLDRADHAAERFEARRRRRWPSAIRSAATRKPSGRGPSNRSVHSRSAASPRSRTSATIGAATSSAVLERRPHGTSLSIGSTRIDVAPASFSAGRSVQTSSASTAAWTAISPSSASWSTDGRAHARQERADRGQVVAMRVQHHVAPAASGDDAGEHQLEASRRARVVPRRRRDPPTSTASEERSLPTGRRPFALIVEPVETRSTIASARPSRGAASTEPETGTREQLDTRLREQPPRRDGVRGRDAETVEIGDVVAAARRRARRPRASSVRSRARRG